jgi:FkbM family methyltransferase
LENLRIRERLPEMWVRYPGLFTFHIPAGDRMYTRIFLQGAWEPSETAAMRFLLRPGDFAVDIGANYGWFTLLMAETVGARGTVWAFEPVPEFSAELRKNCMDLQRENLRVFDCAMGSSDGEIDINVFAGLPHGHASAATFGRDDFRSHRVSVHTLDGLLAENENLKPALVKVDVEGFEMHVLEGSRHLLGSDDPPIWMLEVNAETAGAVGYRPAALVDALGEHGHHCVFAVSRRRMRRSYVLRSVRRPDQEEQDGMWICVPASKMDRLAGLV